MNFLILAAFIGIKVVSLTPSITEIIYAIGAGDKLVGVVKECDYPEEVKNLPIVGNYILPNVEKIISLSPDIVFVGSGVQKPIASNLQTFGINVCVIEPQNIEEIYEAILKIGKLLNKKQEAESLVAYMKNELTEITKLKPEKKKKVFIEIQTKPLITCGKNSFINDIINLANAINIAGNIDNPYPIVGDEFVIESNPDVIIIVHKSSKKEEVKKRAGWEKLSAIKNNAIIDDIDENLIVRPGPRVINGIKTLKQKIYPEVIK